MKKLVLTVVLVAGAFVSWRLDAASPARIQAERALEMSDVAAVVEITSGQLLPCGVGYHGRVTEHVKGDFRKDDDVYFGPFEGRDVGGRYLVFLQRKPQRQADYNAAIGYRPLLNGLTPDMLASLEKRNEECFATSPPWVEMHSGMAAMEIGRPLKGTTEAVLFREHYVLAPKGARRTKWVRGDDEEATSERVWVDFNDVVSSLRAKVGASAPK
jgi:hypothetical protein